MRTTITIPKRELKTVVQESIRGVLKQEFMKFRAMLLPAVSEKSKERLKNCMANRLAKQGT